MRNIEHVNLKEILLIFFSRMVPNNSRGNDKIKRATQDKRTNKIQESRPPFQ